MFNVERDPHESMLIKAKDAVSKRNFEYAVTLLLSYLKNKPESYEARTLLREAQEGKNAGKSFTAITQISFLLSNLSSYIKIIQYKLKKDNEALAQELETLLCSNPKDSFLLSTLADTLLQLKYNEPAIDLYKMIIEVKKDDIKSMRALVSLFLEIEDFEGAREYCNKILKKNPGDGAAEKMLRDMAAIGTINKGWSDSDSDFFDRIKDSKQAAALDTESKTIKSEEDVANLIEVIKKELEDTPDNISKLRELGKLYIQVSNFDEAESTLEKAVSLSGADRSLKMELIGIKRKRMESQLKEINTALDEKPDEELQKQANELVENIADLEMENYKNQVEEYPTDMDLRYELGIRYMDKDMIDQAISELQLAVKSPAKKILALKKLGECFCQKQMYDLAKDQLFKALESMSDMNDMKKDTIYTLGMVYENMGDLDQATTEYKKIYEVDINFRDITEKIENIYKKQHK